VESPPATSNYLRLNNLLYKNLYGMKEKFDILITQDKYATRFHRESDKILSSNFDLDRDRIVYSKEFRRLKGKTQVFVSGFDDNVRNRLTHTIEVSQISQRISKILGLNETLTETISLAHDVGHTPFGHIGERTLNYIMNGCDKIHSHYNIFENQRGFKHNWQGIRVVSDLERITNSYPGMNLSNYTLWGILHHSKLIYGDCGNFFSDSVLSKDDEQKKIYKCNLRHKYLDCDKSDSSLSLSFYEPYTKMFNQTSWSFEALVVRIADEIAQRSHDIEDSLIAGLLSRSDIVDKIKSFTSTDVPSFYLYFSRQEKIQFNKILKTENDELFIKQFSDFIINFLIGQLIINSRKTLTKFCKDFQIKTTSDLQLNKREITKRMSCENLYSLISFESDFARSELEIQKFMWNRILNSHLTQTMDNKANYVIRNLIKAYVTNPKQLPDNTIILLFKRLLSVDDWEKNYHRYSIKELTGVLRKDLDTFHHQSNSDVYKNTLLRTICDFISGMTDDYAMRQFQILYGSTQVFKNNGV
jgi:dGTPase